MKHNIFYMDNEQVAILNREGVLPWHLMEQYKLAYAKAHGIGEWHSINKARSIGLRHRHKELGLDLPKWPS